MKVTVDKIIFSRMTCGLKQIIFKSVLLDERFEENNRLVKLGDEDRLVLFYFFLLMHRINFELFIVHNFKEILSSREPVSLL